MNLVIVESPAKARTINKYLGDNYRVIASYGHVRDLPSKDGSVLPDQDFEMLWEVDGEARKHVKAIADNLKDSDKLILATDPDREGEAISWHILQVLKERKALKDIKVERVVFNAITERAVREAMAAPREIDQELVDAYLARRALDYLVGFTLSPILWRKLPGAKSAGRVQSVALRLVCDRELEIEAFRSQEYWTVEAEFETPRGESFGARLVELKGKKLEKFDLANEAAANAAVEIIRSRKFKISALETKPARRNPWAPFTTSTLTQEAARKLGFGAKRTMQIAQRLYEGVDIGGERAGLITYMRTDGVDITPEALAQIRAVIAGDFGKSYLPDAPRIYRAKAKNAQEAHEAIRPTSLLRKPADMRRFLEEDQARLYELIWKRTIASQMESARIERTTATLAPPDEAAILRATGSVILFDGFLKLYQEGRDDTAAEGEDGTRLPQLTLGEEPRQTGVTPSQHFTEPPPRYTEATLIKKLEELGIGRPSTYASILSTLQDRDYVTKDQNRFIPQDKGRLVTAFLESFFLRYVEYDFTASLEERLDQVSSGDVPWKDLLREFWRDFMSKIDETKELRVTDVLESINTLLGPHIFPPKEDGTDPRQCSACGTGRLSLKTGKFGAFIGCSNYPECRYTRQLGQNTGAAGAAEQGPVILGTDDETGLPVSLRNGRFGPYVQLGEGEGEEKPKRAGLPKEKTAADMTLELALKLLRLPRDVGLHPESGKPIQAGIGRYGPYIVHDKKYARLESADEAFTIGLNRAVALLAESQNRGPRRQGAAPLRELGAHPSDGAQVRVMNGRYGPYVSHDGVNATLPRTESPETITLESAIALLAERAEKTGKGGKSRKGRRAAPSPKKDGKAASGAAPAAKKPKAAKKTSTEKPKKTAKAKSPAPDAE